MNIAVAYLTENFRGNQQIELERALTIGEIVSLLGIPIQLWSDYFVEVNGVGGFTKDTVIDKDGSRISLQYHGSTFGF